MPPKKKSRLPSRGPSTPSAENRPPTPLTTQQDYALKPTTSNEVLSDPWTDEQETTLLKGIIKWKPVGMHKHFRMIAISEYLRNSGYVSRNDEHTKVPGIWEKLRSMYNLTFLDDRENTFGDGADDHDPKSALYCPFSLPEDEFGDLMFERRLASTASDSAPVSETGELKRDGTLASSDIPSSPAAGAGRKPGRGGRASRGTRASRLQAEAESTEEQRSNAAASVDGDDTMHDVEAEEEEAEEGTEHGDGGEAEEDEDAEDASTSKGSRRGGRGSRARAESNRGSVRRGGRRR